eukprot:scaffold215382_cov19-Tisochrysis_lutea.AAC.2
MGRSALQMLTPRRPALALLPRAGFKVHTRRPALERPALERPALQRPTLRRPALAQGWVRNPPERVCSSKAFSTEACSCPGPGPKFT